MASSKPKISVLLIDDHPPILEGLRAIIERTDDLYVIGTAQDGDEGRRLVQELCPDIILLDLIIRGFSRSAFEKWVREHYPGTTTLVLTSHDRDMYLAEMMESGVAGYLTKDIQPDRLVNAIRRAANGEKLFDESQKERVQNWCENVKKKLATLSEREKVILGLLAIGATNRFIAKELRISSKTVDKHLEHIYRKIGVNSRSEAILWGHEHINN